MAGSWAGDSLIRIKVSYRDKATGKLIAEPEFKRVAVGKGPAMGGGIAAGADDNLMLTLIVADICAYTKANR